MTSSEPRPLAFLCHSSGDKEQVRELYWRLQGDGVCCWFDEEDLLPGQDWEFEINKAIRASAYIIVCLSHNSINKRGFVQKELKMALDLADELPQGAVFVIPVRLENCEPPERIGRFHRVDLFNSVGYKHLLKVLQPHAVAGLMPRARGARRLQRCRCDSVAAGTLMTGFGLVEILPLMRRVSRRRFL